MCIFSKKANNFVLHLHRFSESGEIIPARLIYYTILQIVAGTILGADIQNMKSGVGESMRRLLKIQAVRLFTSIYSWEWIFMFTTKAQEEKKCKRIIRQSFDKLIDEMRNQSWSTDEINEEESKTISLQNYLPKNITGVNDFFTNTEFRDEAITLLISGTDTSTVTTGMTLVALGLYPEIQKKMYDEVMTVIGPTKNIEVADLPKLKYAEMVMKESLRYFNPVNIIFRKAEADITLGSTFIPKNSDFIISLKSVHFNPKFWPDPLKYDPERFSSDKARSPYTFSPFSAGIRPCIGKKFAYLLVKTLLATVIRKYEVFTDYKSLQEIEYNYDFVISPREGYKLRVRERN